MASAADNNSGDSGSTDAGDSSTGTDDSGTDSETDNSETDDSTGGSTYDSIDDLINDLIDDLNDDSGDDSTDDGSEDESEDDSDDGSGDESGDNSDEGSEDESEDGSEDNSDEDPEDNSDDDSEDESEDGSKDNPNDDSKDESSSESEDNSDDGSDNGSNGGSGTESSAESESSSSNSNSNSNTNPGSSSSSSSNSSSSSSSSGSTSNSSSNSSSSGSDSDSDSSSMGSGISTEPVTNIEVKELATRNVISGYHIEYVFPENVTCITHVEYDSIRTFRKTTAIVEALKGKSTLVTVLPQGEIYKHVNIWIGENAAGLPTSLKNGLVGFRVEKDWIGSNNISESLVTLQWYSKDEGWKPLDTKKTGEDEKFLYFESQTPGYSFFAITEYNPEEEKQTQLQKTLRTLTGKDNGIAREPLKVAKMFLAIALPLFMIIAGYGVLKKKI